MAATHPRPVGLARARPGRPQSTPQRLVAAADDEISERGTLDVSMASVAERAGVSRATAFRHLGNTGEMIAKVALRRSESHLEHTRRTHTHYPDVLTRVQEGLVYTVCEVSQDPAINYLLTDHPQSDYAREVLSLARIASEPELLTGQAEGTIRSDLPIDELVGFLTEQIRLAASLPDRSEQAVRRRFRNFIAPALRGAMPAVSVAGGGHAAAREALLEAEKAVRTARRAVEDLGLDGDLSE